MTRGQELVERVEQPADGRKQWDPMRLQHVGEVGELMRTSTVGSKRDGTLGCGSTRRRVSATGTPC